MFSKTQNVILRRGNPLESTHQNCPENQILSSLESHYISNMFWTGFMYILSNIHNTVLYSGATDDLYSRLYEHLHGVNRGFSFRYNVTKLVYYECFLERELAFEREAQIKSWNRAKKVRLIESINPTWADLTHEIRYDHVDRYR